MNQLILGDNLEIMQKMDSESVDLIYLDPPFFSNRNYEVIWGDKGEIRSFEDRWSGGIEHYIAWLKERVAEMHRLLKPTGSIYLHCDYHADAYIRVYILDKIFGENNFQSNITWKRTTAKSISKKMPNNTDTIFYYTKSSIFTYTVEYLISKDEYVKSHYFRIDLEGRKYRTDNLKAPVKGYHYVWNKVMGNWRCPIEKMREYEKEGRLRYTKNGIAEYVRYLDESKGVPVDNNWIDINPINSQANERIGYPTQKPEKLLERIILASSNKGDVVFDPFVGGGTSIVVAEKLQRKWIGIDQSVQAVKVSELRLDKILYSDSNHVGNLYAEPYTITLHKYDYDTLRYKDAFEFESWIITQFGYKFGFPAIPQKKKGGDKGFDGKTKTDGAPIQVKRSDNISVNVIKNFYSSCVINDKAGTKKRKEAGEPIGYIIAFTFGSGAIQEVAKLRLQENIIIKLLRVDEIVEIAHKPKIIVKMNDLGFDSKNLREIEFTATGESDSGIEFYSWDFEYNESEKRFNANIMLDKDGKQTHKFKPGYHSIAVKVVDNEGLEAVEVVKVKINGEIVVN